MLPTLTAPPRRYAFTLIELLVVIAIVSTLAAILFPVFAQTHERARMAACLSNMRQLATGMQMYAQDHDEAFVFTANYDVPAPGRPIWTALLHPYVKNEGIFRCPSASGDAYAADWNARGFASIGFTAQMAYVSDLTNAPSEAFSEVVYLAKLDEPTRTPFFADTPNADVGSGSLGKHRSYTFDPCVADSLVNTTDARLSTPLIADTDLVKTLGATLPAGSLKPVFARHQANGNNAGRATVMLADGHVTMFSAAQILAQDKGANLLWRFRGCP